jgi:hypothetical protein
MTGHDGHNTLADGFAGVFFISENLVAFSRPLSYGLLLMDN